MYTMADPIDKWFLKKFGMDFETYLDGVIDTMLQEIKKEIRQTWQNHLAVDHREEPHMGGMYEE